MRTKYGTRERLALKLVDLSINNHIVDLIHKHYLINGIYSASAPNERVSRITQLAKLSSTTHRSCSQLTFFNFSQVFVQRHSQVIADVSLRVFHS